ncbi:hypothetical protein LZG74_08835 [Dyadobacter sp. CY327]|uniref:hypothetical protein n=1 Tax=Dyadobacter sp. CY327 TaxID=2907301 RepID=UPI001F2708BF|nr:hypothetical protein [Dyadobacter sp. CY327]MCE7070405.1 hypothetical protein [Dyadobacter sp. CY327]
MNLKFSTIILSTALVGGTITAICLSICQKPLPQKSLEAKAVPTETVPNCKYEYDEIAHKLVAYSPTGKCAAGQRNFSFKIGSRISDLTNGSLTEPQIVTL